jgi:hypothetical protein
MTTMNLREQIEQMEDVFLVEQYVHKKGDYTEEALTIMKEALAQRNITEEHMQALLAKPAPPEEEGIRVTHDTMIALPDLFSPTDLTAVHALLREKAIPFSIESAADVQAMKDGAQRQAFRISIPAGSKESAVSALEEHFEATDGHYRMRYSSINEKLRSFNFQEIQASNLDLGDEVEVMLTEEEKKTISAYAHRLLEDAEKIEQETERVIFFYDSLETLIEHCENSVESTMHGAELLTIIEILQIYSGDADFPRSMETVAASILNVLSK